MKGIFLLMGVRFQLGVQWWEVEFFSLRIRVIVLKYAGAKINLRG